MVKRYGTRSDVFEGLAEKTRGGLGKDDLMLSKTGKIVSKKKSLAAKASYDKFGFSKRQKAEESKPVEEEKPKKKRRRRKKDSE
jgi:hypothetical protein